MPIRTERVVLTLDTTRFEEAIREAAAALARFDWSRFARPIGAADRHAAHHPAPLAIDGAAYRRRQQARRRGARR